MKTPICWNGHCFPHVESADVDEYRGEIGYLKHQRATGIWLASFRGCSATAMREPHEPAWQVDDRDIARRALDGAVLALRRRVEGDQEFLRKLEEEMG